jgi:hypothetical protein
MARWIIGLSPSTRELKLLICANFPPLSLLLGYNSRRYPIHTLFLPKQHPLSIEPYQPLPNTPDLPRMHHVRNLLTPLLPPKTVKQEDRSISIDLEISIPTLQSLSITTDSNAPQLHRDWVRTLAENTILIYTDGSKQASGSAGCGAVLYLKNGPMLRPVASRRCCLGQTATVFDAELHAIQEGLRALDQLLRPGMNKNAYLCIDNQAAIATLANNQFNHQYA